MASAVVRHLARVSCKRALTPVCRRCVTVPKRYLSLSQALNDRFYTNKHEWVSLEKGVGTVGISDYAQEQLGEIVYVEVPEVGTQLDAHDAAGCLESVKAASDVFTPVSGEVIEVNTEIESSPQLINSSPMEYGWLFKLKVAAKVDTSDLMDETAYKKFVGSLDN